MILYKVKNISVILSVISLSICYPLVALSGYGNDSSASCGRDCITGLVEEYVDASLKHNMSSLPLAQDIRSTENGKYINPGDGVWRSITRRESYSQVFVDQNNKDAVFFGAFKEGDEPLLMAIRFRFKNNLIVELEHLVSRPDYRNRLVRRHKLTEPNPVFDELLSPGERVGSSELVAIANMYFNGIQNSSDKGVPMHRECIRRENGVVLLHNNHPDSEPCPIGFKRFNYITKIRDRRIAVVDEKRGLVLAWAFFDVPGNIKVEPRTVGPSDLRPSSGEPIIDTRKIPRSLYIAELFKVVGGKIRNIDAIMYNMDLGSTAGWD